MSVVRGMMGLLEKVRFMIIEMHPKRGADVDKLEAMLARTGFKLERFGHRDSTFCVKAVRHK